MIGHNYIFKKKLLSYYPFKPSTKQKTSSINAKFQNLSSFVMYCVIY